MSDPNLQLLRRFIAAFESGDFQTLEEIVDANVIDHTAPPGSPPGLQGLLYAVRPYREGFPDLRISIDKAVSSGDVVIGYGILSGTNTGEFFGMPATGKYAQFSYIDIYGIELGRIVEAWHLEDIAGLMRQLNPVSAELSESV